MKNVVPMRRPVPTLHKYNNAGSIREFELPIGVTLSAFGWMVFAIYFGVIILGVFGVVLITGMSIGSLTYSRQTSLVESCVPTRESGLAETRDEIRKAA